jgi:hypothetical protein
VLTEVRERAELATLRHPLEEAPESRATIEQATGVAMAVWDRSPDEAFLLPARSSRNASTKLRDLAEQVGERPLEVLSVLGPRKPGSGDPQPE